MRHRNRPSLLRLMTQAVLTTVAMTTGGAVVVMASAGMADVPERATVQVEVERSAPTPPPGARLMKRYDCSTTGFSSGAAPQSALVRDPGGKVRAVSFEQGWAVHTAASGTSGTLVAVCLRPVG